MEQGTACPGRGLGAPAPETPEPEAHGDGSGDGFTPSTSTSAITTGHICAQHHSKATSSTRGHSTEPKGEEGQNEPAAVGGCSDAAPAGMAPGPSATPALPLLELCSGALTSLCVNSVPGSLLYPWSRGSARPRAQHLHLIPPLKQLQAGPHHAAIGSSANSSQPNLSSLNCNGWKGPAAPFLPG